MAELLLPDPEELAVTRTLTLTGVAAIVGTRVGTNIPENPTYPLIRLTRVAGGPESGSADDALIEYEFWADDDATASLLARTFIAAHKDMRYTAGSNWLALTDVTSGPTPEPDPVTGRARYIVDCWMRVGWQ